MAFFPPDSLINCSLVADRVKTLESPGTAAEIILAPLLRRCAANEQQTSRFKYYSIEEPAHGEMTSRVLPEIADSKRCALLAAGDDHQEMI